MPLYSMRTSCPSLFDASRRGAARTTALFSEGTILLSTTRFVKFNSTGEKIVLASPKDCFRKVGKRMFRMKNAKRIITMRNIIEQKISKSTFNLLNKNQSQNFLHTKRCARHTIYFPKTTFSHEMSSEYKAKIKTTMHAKARSHCLKASLFFIIAFLPLSARKTAIKA